MVTENFGTRGGSPFITGVVFADVIVDDDLYTIGEGIGNITISAVSNGTGTSYPDTTGSSGGYSLQVPAGTYTVTASGGSGPIVVSDVVVGTQNVKVDFDTSVPVLPPGVQIVDDGNSGFTTTGSWSNSGLGGFGNDSLFASSSAGNQATWTFQVTPGRYRVSATWANHANRASDAPFTLFDGFTALATLDINQEQAPNDFSDAEANWRDLGGPYDISGTLLVVHLSGSANDYVAADAIRIERL